jgi:hypothetical protein
MMIAPAMNTKTLVIAGVPCKPHSRGRAATAGQMG